MQILFPAIKPYQTHNLDVDDVHQLYIEETGNPKGQPVIVLHSGPGAGSNENLRRFFDPELYRIVVFDQRGCGKSTPHVGLINNSTEFLIKDINTICAYLNIERMVLFGGGWGSLLALLYAQAFPRQVQALLLYSIFLGRTEDIDWFYRNGASKVYPDYWADLLSTIPPENRDSLRDYFYQSMNGDNEVARMSSAKQWALWQANCSSLQPHVALIEQYSDPHFALSLATIESHYLHHDFFIEENTILTNIARINNIPMYIVHGRYNLICPLSAAWELHQAHANSQLSIVRDAGHSEQELGMIDAIILASNLIASRVL